jgi:O-antigen/teichoic acid export membrane protein
MAVNGISLLVATILTNVLGLAFWTVAARLATPEDVGRASATVAALLVISTIAQLNLGAIYLRFLPAAGARGRRFVIGGYALVTLIASAGGAIYVLSGLGHDILHTTWGRVGFVGCVVLFALFALQDAVLTSLRLAWWVPIENASFSAVKLALLPVLVAMPAGVGILAAWVIPTAAAVVVINTLLFTTVLRSDGSAPGQLPPARRLLSFLGAEYIAYLCSLATMQVMPLLVAWRLGPVQTAYFTVPWFFWLGIAVLLSNVCSAFVVEAVSHPTRARHALRHGLALWAAVVVASVIGCCVVAPLLLPLIGEEYGSNAVLDLVRLIGVSTPFAAITFIYTAFAWLDQRVWKLAAIQVASGATLIGLSVALTPTAGLAGIGWANLFVQVGGATIMAPAVFSRLRSWYARPADGASRRAHGSARRDQRPPTRQRATAAAGLVLAALPLVAILWPGTRGAALAVVAFAIAGSGSGLMCWVDTGDGLAQAALVVVVSLTAFAAAATALIWLDAWSPSLLWILACVSALSCAGRFITPYHRHAT